MIDTLMIYCFSVAALVSVAAFAIERAVAVIGWPRRAVWIAALSASLCLPLFMIVKGDPEVAQIATTVDAPTFVASASLAEVSAPSGPSLTTVLNSAWFIASSGLLLFVLAGWARLRYSARSWETEMVDGVCVRVSDNLGPAVVGFLKPEIVVPRWLLTAQAGDRRAAIAHESSHIAAGDSLLLLLALLLVVVTPWNLPMWWQLRRLRFAIEVDCDQRVLRGGTSVTSYGEMLLAVARRHSLIPIGAMALTEPVSQLERRIRIMTSGKSRYAALLILAPIAMSASLVTVAAQLDAPPLSAFAPNLFSSSIAARETPQPESMESAAVANTAVSIDQPAPSVINPDVRPADGVAPIKRTKVNATKLAAANPATAKPALTVSSQASASGDIGPKRIHMVMPIYPDAALSAGIYGGFVDTAFTVSITGDVQDVGVTKSEPVGVFDEAALTALRQWRFEPAIKDGQAVPTQLKLRLKFSPGPGYPKPEAQPSDSAAVTTNGQGPSVVYTGEKLTLKFIDIDVREVLKLLADTSGQNILISDKVSGKITLQLASTPWDEALDYIVREKGLVKRQQGGVILIEPGTTASTVL